MRWFGVRSQQAQLDEAKEVAIAKHEMNKVIDRLEGLLNNLEQQLKEARNGSSKAID